MQFLIAADLVPTQSNIGLFKKADTYSLLGKELLRLWDSADIRIFNLEVPLTDKENPIAKYGPNLMAPVNTIKGIKALNPSLITLANNHILDQSKQGLRSTKDLLKKYNIPFVGIGDSLSEASKPYIIHKDRLQVGIYACAEHEFSIAAEYNLGANPFAPLESLDHIQNLKSKCDYVIVLYHGGKEHYRYPSPHLQKMCRKIVQKGANIVLCQHSHCIGCYENYEGSTIVYGQGNFIFNKKNDEFWETSLLIKVNINDNISLDYIPIVQTDEGIRLASRQAAANILSAFHQRSNDILQDGFVKRKYEKFAQENIQAYLGKFSGFDKWLVRIDKYLLKGMLIKLMYNKNQLLAIQNNIECEAHRELVLSWLKAKEKAIGV